MALTGRVTGIEEMEGYKDMLCLDVKLDMPKKEKSKDMICCSIDKDDEIDIPMSASDASEYKVGDKITINLVRSAKSETVRGRLGSSLTKSTGNPAGGNK